MAGRAAGFQVDLMHQVSRIVAAEAAEALSTRVTEVTASIASPPFWLGNHCAGSHKA